MASKLVRGKKIYVKIQDIAGEWERVATGYDDTAEGHRAVDVWIAKTERRLDAERVALGGETAPLTVARYADRWLDRRKTITVADDKTRLKLHALPRVGSMMLSEVKPRHIRDLVLALRADGKLAPATIRQVSGLLHTLFKSAQIEELVASNPVVFDRGVLPKKVDKDPTWRHEAIYTRGEIEALISDERILNDRRVLYALKSLGAFRHTEAATLTWSQYDQVAKPLGAINLGVTKNGVPRRMPVHSTLAKLLAEWKLAGWEALYGRKPKPEDLIVPTRNLTARDANESQRQLIADLELLKLRTSAGKKQHRRGHDMRRTFITLARTDGAAKDILRWVTHGPTPSEMMDLYSSFDWSALCGEVAKLKIELLEGKLIALPIAASANGGGSRNSDGGPSDRGPVVVQSSKLRVLSGEKERPRRDSNPCYLRERRVS